MAQQLTKFTVTIDVNGVLDSAVDALSVPDTTLSIIGFQGLWASPGGPSAADFSGAASAVAGVVSLTLQVYVLVKSMSNVGVGCLIVGLDWEIPLQRHVLIYHSCHWGKQLYPNPKSG